MLSFPSMGPSSALPAGGAAGRGGGGGGGARGAGGGGGRGPAGRAGEGTSRWAGDGGQWAEAQPRTTVAGRVRASRSASQIRSDVPARISVLIALTLGSTFRRTIPYTTMGSVEEPAPATREVIT